MTVDDDTQLDCKPQYVIFGLQLCLHFGSTPLWSKGENACAQPYMHTIASHYHTVLVDMCKPINTANIQHTGYLHTHIIAEHHTFLFKHNPSPKPVHGNLYSPLKVCQSFKSNHSVHKVCVYIYIYMYVCIYVCIHTHIVAGHHDLLSLTVCQSFNSNIQYTKYLYICIYIYIYI
jgi:hypothetical protein